MAKQDETLLKVLLLRRVKGTSFGGERGKCRASAGPVKSLLCLMWRKAPKRSNKTANYCSHGREEHNRTGVRLEAADPLVVGWELRGAGGSGTAGTYTKCPAGGPGIGGDSPVVRGMRGSAQGLSVGAERQRGCWSASSCRARVAPGIRSAMDFKGIIYLYTHIYIYIV